MLIWTSYSRENLRAVGREQNRFTSSSWRDDTSPREGGCWATGRRPGGWFQGVKHLIQWRFFCSGQKAIWNTLIHFTLDSILFNRKTTRQRVTRNRGTTSRRIGNRIGARADSKGTVCFGYVQLARLAHHWVPGSNKHISIKYIDN